MNKPYCHFLALGFLSALGHAQDEQAIGSIVQAFHERDDFSGAVLVAEGKRVLFRGAYGFASREEKVDNRVDTRFRLASLSKTFNAVLVMRLVDQGLIDLGDRIDLHLPDLPAEYADRVTVEQLLSHRAGLYRDTLSGSERTRQEHLELEELLEIICDQELIAEPGERYSYSSPGFVLLAAIVESVTESGYQRAMQEHVLRPLRLENTGFDNVGNAPLDLATRYIRLIDEVVQAPAQDLSFAIGAGDLVSTVDDLLKFSLALQSDDFLSKSSRKEMMRSRGSDYGLGVFVYTYGTGEKFGGAKGRVINHGGGTSGVGTHLNIFLEHEITTVVLSNLTEIDVVDVSNRIANVALGLSTDIPLPNRKREVLRALLSADARGAIADLGRLEARDRPKFGELFRLGFGFYEHGDPEKARKIAEFMSGRYPKSEWPWVLLGRIDAEGDPEQAGLAFRRALAKNPQSTAAAQGLRALGKD